LTGSSINWPELVVLMAYGDGTEDSISGELRVREVQEVGDGFTDADFGGDGGRFEEHPQLGPVRVCDASMRAHRRGELVRLDRHDERPVVIFGRDTRWVDFGDDGVPTAYPRTTSSFSWNGQELLYRRPASRWEGNDFTKLTGPIESVEFLGRSAWEFELAPPSHKPYPLQMIVDAATGLLLREANADFGSVQEWASLNVDAVLPDELFVWDGPSKPPQDHMAEHERDMARRQDWLAERAIAATLTLPLHLLPHEFDDETGSIYASVEVQLTGTLLRRARSESVWPEVDTVHYPHSHRWSDERWDWFLGSDRPLDDGQLAALREQLTRST
jgi:hypothetical protein